VLRNALISTQTTPDVVTRIKDARMKLLRDSVVSPSIVADRAIAARLFGDSFPYGRPVGGSSENLARVDRTDLMLARERFLNSNNATLAIVGGVTKPRALRTLRQLLGPWRKSEQIIPTTFRQPVPADKRVLIVNSPGSSAEVRVAVRGVARNDNDYFASAVLAKLAAHRWVGLSPDLNNKPIFARSDSFVLPGMFVIGGSINTDKAGDAVTNIQKVIESLVSTPATAAELDRARLEAVNDFVSYGAKPESQPDAWLDVETYGLKSAQNPQQLMLSVNSTDLQRIATRLFKDSSTASVFVGDSLQLKAALQGRAPFEVLGEVVPAVTPTSTPKPPVAPKTDRPR
jgi:zinc protease